MGGFLCFWGKNEDFLFSIADFGLVFRIFPCFMAQFGLVTGVLGFLLPVSGVLLGGEFLCVFGRAVLTCQTMEPPAAGCFYTPSPLRGTSPLQGKSLLGTRPSIDGADGRVQCDFV